MWVYREGMWVYREGMWVYREGMWVYISASSKISPLKQLRFYLALSKISENSEELFFRSLSGDKKFCLCTRNKPIAYSRIREVLSKF